MKHLVAFLLCLSLAVLPAPAVNVVVVQPAAGGGGGGGGISVIANTSAGAPTNTDPATTGAIDTTGADLIVVAYVYSEFAAAPTISDSKSNTWTAMTEVGSWLNLRFAYCAGGTVGSGHTFTCSGGTFMSLAVIAVSGAHATPADQENGTISFSSPYQPGSITPSVDGCLVLCASGNAGSAGSTTINSSMTILETVAYTADHFQVDLAWRVQATAAAINPSWTNDASGSPQLLSIIASFKPE
jgi:hypothetical protein